jgi:hypothetical protein
LIWLIGRNQSAALSAFTGAAPRPTGNAASHVCFGSEADMCAAKSDVRFNPNSDRESRFQQKVMSALPLKADMCGALAHVRFGPKADICGAKGHVRFTPES